MEFQTWLKHSRRQPGAKLAPNHGRNHRKGGSEVSEASRVVVGTQLADVCSEGFLHKSRLAGAKALLLVGVIIGRFGKSMGIP